MITRILVLQLLGLALTATALDVKVATTGGNATSSHMYGIMFEDISHSGDGGIYAELIRNRAFQGNAVFPSAIDPWTAIGGASLSLKNLSSPLSKTLPASLTVTGSNGTIGISNPGYWGFDVSEQDYTGSFWVRGGYEGSFTAAFFNYLSNTTVASIEVPSKAIAGEWTEHTYTLTPAKGAGNANNTFQLTYDAAATNGSLDFNLISLFPPTYNDRPNGLRPELMEALKGLNPSFFRIPGGNNVEGNSAPDHWKWNQTIGPLTARTGYAGTWSYQNTNGLGLIEYLQWCDDLDVEPVLAVWGGFYLDGTAIPEDHLQPWVDDALNELEFITGNANTTYGAMRASLGYPEPWTIKYVEVGNEDNLNGGFESYVKYRFQMFKDAISAKYPDIYVFSSTTQYNFAHTQENVGEDFHEYTRPDEFVSQFGFFDHNTTGFKTMIGEYATVQPNIPQGGGTNWSLPRLPFPTWIGSIGEAVFTLGAERNGDKVFGAAYAPLLQNLNSYQWSPDLISFTADPSETVLSTSYHVLRLLGSRRISRTLPMSSLSFDPAYYVAGYSEQSDAYILKAAVYNATEPVAMNVSFDGVGEGTQGNLTVLTAPDAFSYNNIKRNVVVTKATTLTADGSGQFAFELENYSVALLEVDASSQ